MSFNEIIYITSEYAIYSLLNWQNSLPFIFFCCCCCLLLFSSKPYTLSHNCWRWQWSALNSDALNEEIESKFKRKKLARNCLPTNQPTSKWACNQLNLDWVISFYFISGLGSHVISSGGDGNGKQMSKQNPFIEVTVHYVKIKRLQEEWQKKKTTW